MTEQEHSKEPEEREETVEDLDVPDGQTEDVKGGAFKWGEADK
jgi:hypothetical protein